MSIKYNTMSEKACLFSNILLNNDILMILMCLLLNDKYSNVNDTILMCKII